MMVYGYGGGGGWMWGFAGLMLVGALVLIALAVWAIVTSTDRARQPAGDLGTPVLENAAGRYRTRQVLDERYARGEMTADDYTDRLHTLGL